MPFVKKPGLTGKIYVPAATGTSKKKHDCPDCFACQMCSESRCHVCRQEKTACRDRPAASKGQIRESRTPKQDIAMKTRIDLPSNEDLPQEIRSVLEVLPPLNAFRMMAVVPESFKPYIELAGTVLSGVDFDSRLREIAVLRVVRVLKCDYAWTHHVTVGKGVGLTNDQIEIIKTEDPVSSLDEESNLLCRVADEITRDVRLSDEMLLAIKERYGNKQAGALILCCSYFNMLGRCLEGFRVELEPEKVL
ncbi:MAG: carboxymuconolactone decarboxylase family protein [Desulfosudaceae bacterium]